MTERLAIMEFDGVSADKYSHSYSHSNRHSQSQKSHVISKHESPDGGMGIIEDSFETDPGPESCGDKCSLLVRMPKSVWFIFGTEFCERFSYYGMKSILILYFTDVLLWSDSTATSIYHTFVACCYFTPIFGAFVADSWLGKYWTIIILSIVYALGHVVKSVSSIPKFDHDGMVAGTIVGLVLIALGTGGIKPCVAAFGGDQIPTYEVRMREMFFFIFYFAINVGSLLSEIVTPRLRHDVQCYGQDCYPLAFGVPAILFIIALIVFICGTSMYNIKPPTGSILKDFFKATWLAIKNRFKYGKTDQPFLYNAVPDYDVDFLDDLRRVYKVAFLFLPVPFFWMGFDQQGSTWTLQAKQMDGDVGIFTIYPDNVQAVNPILILILIPLTSNFIYPVLAKIGLRTQLQKMSLGMILAAISFAMAAFLQITIDDAASFKPLVKGKRSVWGINSSPCPIEVQYILDGDLESSHWLTDEDMTHRYVYGDDQSVKLSAKVNESVCSYFNLESIEKTVEVSGHDDVSYVFFYIDDDLRLQGSITEGNEDSSDDSDCYMNFYSAPHIGTVEYQLDGKKTIYNTSTDYKMSSGTHRVTAEINGESYEETFESLYGGIYIATLSQNGTDEYYLEVIPIQNSTFISILWQVPQYVVITLGEVMFSITGLDFSYSEASPDLKSVMQAVWLLTTAFGNILDIILVGNVLEYFSRGLQFAVCAIAMFVSGLVFILLAYLYVPRAKEESLGHYKMMQDDKPAGAGGRTSNSSAKSQKGLRNKEETAT